LAESSKISSAGVKGSLASSRARSSRTACGSSNGNVKICIGITIAAYAVACRRSTPAKACASRITPSHTAASGIRNPSSAARSSAPSSSSPTRPMRPFASNQARLVSVTRKTTARWRWRRAIEMVASATTPVSAAQVIANGPSRSQNEALNSSTFAAQT